MKLTKKLVVLALAVVAMFGLVACGNSESADDGVKVYTVEAKFNSDEVNQWKNIYLLDDDTYVFTVYALDSQDSSKVTADFYMAGNYTLDGDVLTIELGYGYCTAMNGDTPIEMAVTPDNPAMYYAMAGAQATSFTLTDGTFEIVQ